MELNRKDFRADQLLPFQEFRVKAGVPDSYTNAAIDYRILHDCLDYVMMGDRRFIVDNEKVTNFKETMKTKIARKPRKQYERRNKEAATAGAEA